MSRLLPLLFLGLVSWGTVAEAADADRIPAGYVSFHRGHRVSGEQFGVRIGDTEARAFAALAKRNISTEQHGPRGGCKAYLSTMTDCGGMDWVSAHRIKRPFRDGMVFLGFRDGRVAAIYWRTQLVYIDL